MVLVDAVVTDKQGKAIPGLHPEDFVIEENGKAQKVSSLTTTVENTPGASAPVPPGIYSNRPQDRSPGRPITVMLLDAVNTPFTDQSYARRQMLEFVKEQFKPADRMAVFTLTGGLNVLQDFTSDPQALYTALQHFNPQTQPFSKGFPTSTSSDGGPATPASTVASLDASTPPPSDSGSNPGGGRGGSGSGDLTGTAMAAVQAFEGAQVGYARDQRTVVTLAAFEAVWRASLAVFPVVRISFGSREIFEIFFHPGRPHDDSAGDRRSPIRH